MKPLPTELVESLQAISDKEQATIISFVAPQDAFRVSPVDFIRATIQEKEMYRLEEVVRKANTQKLHFIIHTPGGGLNPSYKIARFLRSKFDDIHAFVPYQAASGGTLLCCAANRITLGEIGNLTPVDPQIPHRDSWVSAHSFKRAVEKIKELFGEHSPDEIPSPWQQMANKIDPVIYDDMDALMLTSFSYAYKLLKKSGYGSNSHFLAFRLTEPAYSHSYALLSEEAKDWGFNVSEGIEDMLKLEIYTKLVSTRLDEKAPEHSIDVFYPKQPPSLPIENQPQEHGQNTQ